MLYIFDKDGTLVKGRLPDGNGKTRPANTPDEQVLLPGVYDRISDLKQAGHIITVASNQAGVAWGKISYKQAEALMLDLCAKLDGKVDFWLFSPFDERAAVRKVVSMFAIKSEMRKPSPGMYRSLMIATGFDPAQTVVVGDDENDRIPALELGCQFFWASSFFGWKELYD